MGTIRELQLAVREKVAELAQRDRLIDELENELDTKTALVCRLLAELDKYKSVLTSKSNVTGNDDASNSMPRHRQQQQQQQQQHRQQQQRQQQQQQQQPHRSKRMAISAEPALYNKRVTLEKIPKSKELDDAEGLCEPRYIRGVWIDVTHANCDES